MTTTGVLGRAMTDALSSFDAGEPLRAAVNFWAAFAKHSTRPEISRGPFGLATLQIAALDSRESFGKAMSDLLEREPVGLKEGMVLVSENSSAPTLG